MNLKQNWQLQTVAKYQTMILKEKKVTWIIFCIGEGISEKIKDKKALSWKYKFFKLIILTQDF